MDAPYQVNLQVPRESLGYLLRRAHKLARARSEADFSDGETSFTQWIVLALVNSGQATSCAELSRDMDHDSGAMTRVVDQLQERGLLLRQREARDRRVARLVLTDAGRQVVQELAARVGALWNNVLADFSTQEVSQLISLLDRVVARLEADEEQVRH